MSSLFLQSIQPLSVNAASLVSQEGSLNTLFSLVHTLHKWWKWKQDAALAYEYFNRPILALGDLAVAHIADSPAYKVVAIALASIRSIWEAEQARRLLVKHWNSLKWQITNPTILPFHPALLEPGLKALAFAIALKAKIIFILIAKVCYQSFCLSMHLIDLYQYFSNNDQQERAKNRFVSNTFFLHQEFRTIVSYLQSSNELPFFKKIGVNFKYLDKLHSLSQGIQTTCLEMLPNKTQTQ